MPGTGRYTNYAPTASGRNTLLGKLFKGNSTISNPYAKFVETGDTDGARRALLAGDGDFANNLGKGAAALLQPDVQDSGSAEVSTFAGKAVNLDYTGDANDITIPDLPKVGWKEAGDPANPYMPDIRSPGPGQTDAKSAANLQSDPDIKPADVKGEGYVPGQPGESTARSPQGAQTAVRSGAKLGTNSPLGKSSENEPSGF
jgi:hypothetical protein